MDSEYEYRNGRHGIFSYSVSCQGSHVSKGCEQYKIDVNLEMGRHDRRIVCVVLLSEVKLLVGTTLLHLSAPGAKSFCVFKVLLDAVRG